MDLWGMLSRRVFNMPAPNYCLLGRWLGHMMHGVFKHSGIAAAAAKPGECAIGWIAHYTIGILFALVLASAMPGWLGSPTLPPALAFGVVTVVFPFFIMHPGFGLGVAASKTPDPAQARLRSLMNHAVFGFGLYGSAWLLNFIMARA
jgi:hypothetical protein